MRLRPTLAVAACLAACADPVARPGDASPDKAPSPAPEAADAVVSQPAAVPEEAGVVRDKIKTASHEYDLEEVYACVGMAINHEVCISCWGCSLIEIFGLLTKNASKKNISLTFSIFIRALDHYWP